MVNKWKLTTCLILIGLLVFVSIINYTEKNETYEFGELEIKETTLDDLSENFDQDFIICNYKNKCIDFHSLK